MHSLTVLPNGITVVSETIPHLRSVSVGFWIKCGSRDEVETNSGISHFIEHMLFKGTTTRSARQIAEEMDASGGQLNAFTGKEQTCLYARVLDEQLPFAVEILSDMLINSTFDPDELDREKKVILEEISMYEDTPEEVVHDLLTEAVIPGHPLATAILGTRESIIGLTRDDLVHHTKRFYGPENLIVSAAGTVDHGQLTALVNKHLGGWMNETRLPACQTEPKYPPKTIVRTKEIEQVHLCLAALGPDRRDDRRYPLQVLDMMMGGGMSSRLFQELREQRGLVYSTYSFYYGFSDVGIFGVYAAMNKNNLHSVIEIIHEEMDSIGRRNISSEVARAKEQLKGSLVLGLESTVSRMSRLAKGILYHGEPISLDSAVGRIDSVTSEEVIELASKLLSPRSRFAVSVIGPITEDEVMDALADPVIQTE